MKPKQELERLLKASALRPGCCGKKRKMSQVFYRDTYDGGVWKCMDGFGCKKIEK